MPFLIYFNPLLVIDNRLIGKLQQLNKDANVMLNVCNIYYFQILITNNIHFMNNLLYKTSRILYLFFFFKMNETKLFTFL